jgi:hypothetical protein
MKSKKPKKLSYFCPGCKKNLGNDPDNFSMGIATCGNPVCDKKALEGKIIVTGTFKCKPSKMGILYEK